ncbi:tetrahydrofolate synthase, partial [Lachnotalea glycerini]
MNYEEAVEYILNIPKFTKKNPMDNIKTLMKKLGNPEESMKVIHVAGTNGKGSVCAFLASILRQAGKTNAMFTSPHLIEINERFEINGKKVTNEVFTETFHIVINGVNQMIEEGYSHPTFFEFLFAMAMVIFKRAKVEYAILETGMGGRLDATNVIDKPVMTIITTIALDHMQILGDTIEEIAKEKAGIIKSNVVVVFDGTNEAASRVIEEIASKKRCKYYKLV